MRSNSQQLTIQSLFTTLMAFIVMTLTSGGCADPKNKMGSISAPAEDRNSLVDPFAESDPVKEDFSEGGQGGAAPKSLKGGQSATAGEPTTP